MSRQNIIKLAIGLLLAAAIALGLFRRQEDPYTSYQNVKYAGLAEGNIEDYTKRAEVLEAKTGQEESTAVFLAVGDIMLSRNVAGTIKKANDVNLPFSKMSDVLKSTDFNFANLESPIMPKGNIGGHSMIFAAPEEYTSGLKNYNFKILNLANNHAMDQGIAGLEYTIKHLDELGIKHIGAGKTLEDAWKPAVVEQNGIKICFLGAGYSSVNDGGQTVNEYVARITDVSNLNSYILNLKSTCNFIVATMHAGTEYTRTPNKAQTDFARAAIDAGADMVIGAHSHWVQTVKKYNGKYIFYSLGNFIFDQEWSRDTKEGLVLKITLSKALCHPGNPSASEGYPGSSALKLDSGSEAGMTQGTCSNDLQGSRVQAALDQIELIPVIIENYSTPRPATPEETKNILKKIGETNTILK